MTLAGLAVHPRVGRPGRIARWRHSTVTAALSSPA
jgi:hypothetical protein